MPKPTVFALSGQSPAAGAILSLHSDYRIAAANTKIGFNEAQLGIALPDWVLTNTERTVGAKHAARLLQQGNMMSVDEAVEVGFIDEVAADYPALVKLAVEKAATLGKTWTPASALIKEKQTAAQVSLFTEDSETFMWTQFSGPMAQASFKKFLKK